MYSQSNRSYSLRRALIVTGLVVVGVWLLFGFIPWSMFGKPRDSGQFGDSFGFVNSLFSGLAFGGVIVAIILQTFELRLQREELEATREELRRSAEAQTAMQATMQMTTYLSAISALADAYTTAATGKSSFPAESLRRERLTIHMDWLVGRLQEGEVIDDFKFNARRELQHALRILGQQWQDWLAEKRPYTGQYDLENALHSLVLQVRFILTLFAPSPNTTDIRAVAQDVLSRFSNTIKSIPSAASDEEVCALADSIAKSLSTIGD